MLMGTRLWRITNARVPLLAFARQSSAPGFGSPSTFASAFAAEDDTPPARFLKPGPATLAYLSRPDAVFLSATNRETTRALVERVARELAEKWEESARTPSVAAVLEADALEAGEPDAATQATTLDELLVAAGRRTKKSRFASS